MTLPEIGTNTASAMRASIGDGHDFKNRRQVAAWIGLTPRQVGAYGFSLGVALAYCPD